MENLHRYCGYNQLQPSQFVFVRGKTFQILNAELFFYEYQPRNAAGVAVNFTENEYYVNDLIPPKTRLYRVQSLQIDGLIEIAIDLPSGQPHVHAAAMRQYLDQNDAPRYDPIYFPLFVMYGDTVSLHTRLVAPAPAAGTPGMVIFWGWQYEVKEVEKPPSDVIILDDIFSQ